MDWFGRKKKREIRDEQWRSQGFLMGTVKRVSEIFQNSHRLAIPMIESED